MKCSDKWFRKEIQEKAKTFGWIEATNNSRIDSQGGKEAKFELWKRIQQEKYLSYDYVLGLLDKRRAELREKIRYLLEHRTVPCKIPHTSDPNLKDRRFLAREDSAVYDLIKEILGEFEPDQKEVKL